MVHNFISSSSLSVDILEQNNNERVCSVQAELELPNPFRNRSKSEFNQVALILENGYRREKIHAPLKCAPTK